MNTKPEICFRCGGQVAEGGSYYIIDLKITSGFDGVIDEEADPEKLRKILDKLEKTDRLTAEEDVYKHMKVSLCPGCKNELINSLVGESDDVTSFS